MLLSVPYSFFQNTKLRASVSSVELPRGVFAAEVPLAKNKSLSSIREENFWRLARKVITQNSIQSRHRKC